MPETSTTAAKTPATPAAAGVWPAVLCYALPVFVVALSFGFFLPSLYNGFVDFDDVKLLLENTRYRALDWSNIRWMFGTFYMGHYQPLTWLTYALDYYLWGLDPFGYHLTSLLLHCLNALLFYFLALRLLAWSVGEAASSRLRLAAFFAALLFALHPLRVESVAWVTERRDVLAGLFFLATLLCYLKAAAGDARRGSWLAAAVIFYALSLLSKATAMTLPVVLVVLDVYPLRRFGAAGWFAPETRRVWLEKIPFVVLAAVFAVLAFAAQRDAGALLTLENYGFAKRLGQALFAPAFYLWKMIAPRALSPIYAIPLHLETSDWIFFAAGVAVSVTLTALFILLRRRRPALLAVWLCYLALLAPVLGLTQAGPQFAADRYTYLSGLGWAILAAGALLHFITHDQRLARAAAGVVSAAVVLVLGALTWLQVQVWSDPLTLWRHAVAAYPRASKAQNSLANVLVQLGRQNEAIAHYRLAIQIDPDYKEGHHNLGLTLAGRGDVEGAKREYAEALRIDPRYKEAHNNLAAVLFYEGDLAGAIDHYRRAVAVDPAFKEAHNNLGVVLMNQGNVADAIGEYRAAIKIDPGYKEPHYNLGNALLEQDKVDEAIAEYRAALAIDPNYEVARYNLGIAQEAQKKKTAPTRGSPSDSPARPAR
jgi:tetratricopeptide (TPR) repeat protein